MTSIISASNEGEPELDGELRRCVSEQPCNDLENNRDSASVYVSLQKDEQEVGSHSLDKLLINL